MAVRNEGITELRRGIGDFMTTTGQQRRRGRRRDRAEARFLAILSERILGRVLRAALPAEKLAEVIEEIAERRVDPYSAVERIARRLEVR